MVEKERRGEKEIENDLGAPSLLDSKISIKGEAELAVLHLFHAYHVEVDDLIRQCPSLNAFDQVDLLLSLQRKG